MKNNPLFVGEGLNCVIANPFRWWETFGKDQPEELTEMGIKVEGCTLIFPDEETKSIFCLRFL